jgi:hypothetical protein
MATAREHDADQLLNERIDHALTELRVGERAWAESALTRHAELLSAVHRLTVSAGRTGGIGLALSTEHHLDRAPGCPPAIVSDDPRGTGGRRTFTLASHPQPPADGIGPKGGVQT